MGAGAEILEALARIEKKLDALTALSNSTVAIAVHPRGPGGAVADDADLDSQYGNEEIKRNPPRWNGESFSGKKMSECSPEFLDVFAEFKDYCAGKDEQFSGAPDETAKKHKNARYDRMRAARARGWAKRLRAGWKPAAREPGADDEVNWS